MTIIRLQTVTDKPSLGISACLMGEKVRYNGGHKRSGFCVNVLSDYFTFIPICPEVAIGLGVPRKPVRLTGTASDYGAVGVEDANLIVTQPLYEYGQKRASALGATKEPISGYILMQKSPSCGMERVKIYNDQGVPSGDTGSGIFAKALMETLPLLPVEEEGRLHDPVLKENFFTRIYAWYRWQKLLNTNYNYKTIENYYARYKYVLMAHDPGGYSILGNFLARQSKASPKTLAEGFGIRFMAMLGKHAGRKSHTNVMLHLLGYLKNHLDSSAKQSLLVEIEAYRTGLHPLIAPIRILRHYLLQYGSDYVKQQYYLDPYPDQLGLRNLI